MLIMLKLLSRLHLKLHLYIPSLTLAKAPQKAFITKLDQTYPENDSLSYTNKKYLSHRFIGKKKLFFLYDIISVALLPPMLIFLLIQSFFRKKEPKKESIYFSKLIPIDEVDPKAIFCARHFSLSIPELFFVLSKIQFKILRPYFALRVLSKSGLYFDAINRHSPSKIYCTEEMNFESPFLSFICNTHKVFHSNVMHGDKPFYIKDAFIHFDEFYVWQNEFAQLFDDMCANVTTYNIFNPIPKTYRTPPAGKNIFKYYAQNSISQEEFQNRLKNCMAFAKKRGLSFTFRPHPRHFKTTELAYLKRENIRIEPFSISILDSIADAEIICAEWSSVLFQAKFMKKNIVVDNTNSENITKLNELDFVILKEPSLTYLV